MIISMATRTVVEPGQGEADGALVARMADGDEHALASLYDRHGRVLFALAYQILGDRDDAEEVVLEAFTQAWRNSGTYAPDRGSVAAWLVVLSRSRALDRRRARSRHAQALERAAVSVTGDEVPAMGRPAEDASKIGERKEQRAQVLAALQELPAPQRDCLQLAYYEGLSQTEIAARLTEPLGTVKTRMRLGLMKLRELLTPLSTEFSA